MRRFAQQRDELLRDDPRADDVRVEHGAHLGDVLLFDGRAGAHGCRVVDEHVEPAEPAVDLRGGRGDGAFVGGVHHRVIGGDALIVEFLRELGEFGAARRR
nr:hypothetical protein [Bifidobacterium saguinibicoloris]